MSARTAVETIQAAIEKLEALKAESTPGPWRNLGGDVETVPEFDLHRFDDMGETIARTELRDGDAELIVTLHRTIDAQLAILRNALVQWQMFADGKYPDAPVELEVALARAILGEES